MPYHKTIYGDATTRLRFSQKNVVNQQAINRLNHALDVFRDSTGLQPRGARGVLPPEGMTSEQKEVFDNIIENFLKDSRSAQEIKQDYKDAPYKGDEKAETLKEKEDFLMKQERIANDERLHKELYSKIIKEIWDIAKDNWLKDKDDVNRSNRVYKAMIDTLDELDNGLISDTEDEYIDSVIDKMESGFY